ncbi:MAG: acyl-CoA dehydrogenase family protein [Candidatus Geothermincolia bacterium]
MYDYLMTEEQIKLREEVRDFVRWVPRQLILDMDADNVRFPKEYLVEAARRNLLGLRFPKEYGGRGLGWAEESVAISEIGVLNVALACLYSLVSIVGECVAEFGTDEQKEKYLKPTLSATLCTAEGLTEPRGGSDFFGATTTAERKGDYYILNGQKRFIVGAEGADYFMVYAKTDPAKPPRDSMSVFMVDRTEGVEVKHVYGLMGTRGGGTGRLLFKNAKVPVANRVGEENEGSKIFYRMMIPERMTSASGTIGASRELIKLAARYSTRRKAFGTPIKNFEAVSFKIAESLTTLDAMQSLVYTTAQAFDRGVPASYARRLVSECKKFCTEGAWSIVNHVMQAMGGIGYTNVYPVERVLRDTRLIMIWTGTNEIMNLIIQHEFYKELAADKSKIRNVEEDAPEAFNDEEKIYE